jgi:hypothetical protein
MIDRDMGSTILTRVAVAEPRLALDEALRLLIQRTDALSGGLFLGCGKDEASAEVQLIWGQGLDQVGLERARLVWSRNMKQLAAGEPVWNTQWCVWPLDGPRGPVLVYLAAARALAAEMATRSIVGLADVFRAASAAQAMLGAPATEETPVTEAVEWYLAATPPERVARKQFELLLQQNEWNLSRVARALGVTRVTVYRKLARFGIERLRWRDVVRERA